MALATRRIVVCRSSGNAAHASRWYSRGRTTSVKACAHFDPYRTLNIDVLADEASIKKAYRKLALQLHPDVCRSGSVDAERRFVEVTAAYELLIGKARGKEIQEPGTSGWDWHDWYWQFRAQQKINKQQAGGGPGIPVNGKAGNNQMEINTQLAGLRHRSAIRATRLRSKQQQQQSTSDGSSSESTCTTNAQQPEQHEPSPLASVQEQVHFDATEVLCDGAEAPASTTEEDPLGSAGVPPPHSYHRLYAGTTDTKQHVANQIVGLRRRSAIKQRHTTV